VLSVRGEVVPGRPSSAAPHALQSFCHCFYLIKIILFAGSFLSKFLPVFLFDYVEL
jgi:hypothetical protein